MFGIVDEPTRFDNVCPCITFRISAIPPDWETIEILTLWTEVACNAFCRIYKQGRRSDLISDVLKQLDLHVREWERKRTGVLHVQHSGSLAAVIELSLISPMFRELGPNT